ncbi:RING-14 protein, variant 1 [Blastomyces gilchristii SLH14081]|uniref:RING-14 protein n=2 Tax=Blastomyces TaxID=229219 RepID=A0A179UQ65_BLAGS|nr:RING-14 protein [Blastomyces gilchristii SLH14081]XP_031578730.1 RING-14 protein, variant 1 [Blastomyces gilchristii SLH14081]EGE80253.1 RING-14 protein [Blastomyces dermatitidis ATCC 18188]KMW67226.1 RING-14 protein, variant [Blastomyces dermatitidis ATCC 18188]OAT09256.1 RING-14 protein [Blastomyces gilchristii SLH14081]OAT09257.1 RING-14 protein, variant 1 [Blastomyces gilchristii SLH14081]
MKFARDYTQILNAEDYPAQWVQSAISYKRLKKCIKKVCTELLSLGLRPEILNLLWHQSQAAKARGYDGAGDDSRPFGFQYSLSKNPFTSFWLPKLTFVIDPMDGSPIDAFVSPRTLEFLQQLNKIPLPIPAATLARLDSELGSFTDDGCLEVVADGELSLAKRRISLESVDENAETAHSVEIPLSADSEFFQILNKELSGLDKLQEREQIVLNERAKNLRQQIVKITKPQFRRSQSALYTWREIFRLYIDMQVFFCTDEQGSGQRDSKAASQQLEKFQATLTKDRRIKKLGKEGRAALETFLCINNALLQNLKFQEINRTALYKILKKFDKRTALPAGTIFPELMVVEAFLAETMAKAVCYTISEEVLTVIPQLDDYLCPICFNISFKPVRLRCNHVFCIRCLVVMQRAKQDKCALCREEVVLSATGANLDMELLAFLAASFPKETKAKQKENERAAMVDLYGNSYDSCSVM